MTLEIALTACSMLLIIGLTPGPSTVRAATLSISAGVPTGLFFAVGVGVGYACVLLICSSLLNSSRSFGPNFEMFQRCAGIALVFWMSLKIILSKPSNESPFTVQAAGGAIWRAIILQFVNPKAWIAGFIVTEGATSGIGSGSLTWWVLPLLSFVILFLSVAVWALASGLLRPMMNSAFRFRAFHAAMGLCLMGTVVPAMSG